MSNIAVLGSGRVAKALAGGFTAAGHDVTIGSRHPEKTSADWDGPQVEITGVTEAVRGASVVVNATPGDSAVERLSAIEADLAGRILVDVSNAVTRGSDGAPGDLVYPNNSLAEHLQKALPQTRVVKTLNSMLGPVMVNPAGLTSSPTAFLSGDDAEAKAVVRGLLGDLGWESEQVLDLGGIRSARGTEALMLLVPHVMKSRGFVPFAVSVTL